jgi:ABC-2 type transport system permease protein
MRRPVRPATVPENHAARTGSALSIYAALFVQMLKVRLAYKGDFLADLVATALGSVASLLFVLLIFTRVPELQGWSREEILLIYGMSMISYGMFGCVSWNLYEFGDRYIIQGQFDRVLLRPAYAFVQVLFDSFRIPALSESVIGLGVVGFAAGRLELSVSAVEVAFGGVAVVSGFVIFSAVFTILASLSFHFEDRIGVSPPVFNMINFGRYPQTIFPPVLAFLLRWVIPFGFVSFYPATGILGRSAYAGLAILSPVVALGFSVLAGILWRVGVRRYESTGF